ncbi:Metallo-dependent hydrolase [Polychaeton citri CBS 116435]|uniref:Metallo-dependent hydrolase n=1 Tax=Polychaeton citri CBS 116435 TaxID=1314669 RepID=A0A9P4QB03_9PEZI|nr:Metallo-dependent hydrolase [Polychaeton citri CBS 116435]
MYDETEYANVAQLSVEQKRDHYRSVLTPTSSDDAFLDTLPDPRPFGDFISKTREYLQRYPLSLIGEVGLDKGFRIPDAWLPGDQSQRNDALTPGGREGRKLSPYRVDMEHQRKVLLAQLRLAGEMHRAVSIHGVQAHGVVHDTLAATWAGYERKVVSKKEQKRQAAAINRGAEPPQSSDEEHRSLKPYPPRVCLHSFSGPAETVKLYVAPSVPCKVFFSFSTTINSWASDDDGKVEAAVRAVPNDRLMIESDLHTAGEKMDQYLEEIVRKICEVKEWQLEEGVKILRDNWCSFIFGTS